ncbi:MAG TPA: ABC transporter substrate-binding protein [Candidatus Binatia bacterium]|nr:ABC transporter substrate-binding protein [Candidatus Binatia bacterium]
MRIAWSLLLVVLLATGPGALAADAQTKVTYLLTSPAPDVAQAPHSSVPLALGYWKEAGLDVDVQPASGSTAAAQLVIAGTAHATMGTVEPLIIGRQKGAKIVAVYNHTREGIYTIAVPADSPVTSIKELKGKSIGVLSLGSGAVPFAKAVVKGEGLDPDKDVSWVPIGQGAQAVHAVKQNRVDALAYWDWGYAIMENHGAKFRHFSSDLSRQLLALTIIANQEFVEAQPDAVVKLAQGIAKATLFTLTNPEAAVKIHWARYPASKPTGIPEDRALAEAIHVLKARADKYRIDGRAVPKWGAFSRDEWVRTQDFLYDNGLVAKKLDVAEYYTDRFIPRINEFDAARVREQATGWK